jgi:rod shape-determining protein MreB and related proteins
MTDLASAWSSHTSGLEMERSRFLAGVGGRDIAVDLGTANTVVFVRGEGVVLFQPSVVAIEERSGEVYAVGDEARRMIGRTPASIRALRPLRHGVIADYDVTEQMLRHFIRAAIGRRHPRPRVMLCVPSGITEVERRAVEEATVAAGARSASLIEEPMAAAIGAELPVGEPRASMVLDIGGGTSEVAVISLGETVVWESVRVGGYEMDEAIVAHTKREHGLLIGQESAEEVKIKIGSSLDQPGSAEAIVGGRDVNSGLLRRTTLDAAEIRRALESTVDSIVEAVKRALERTPPELSADVVGEGIVVAGGGALLPGIDQRLHHETALPITIADAPLTCVARGAGQALEELDTITHAHQPAKPRPRRRPTRRFRP